MEYMYLLRRVWDEQRIRFLGATAALAVAGFLEGVALASLIPLLQLAGSGGTTPPQGRLGTFIGSLMEVLHLPFNLLTVLLFGFVLVFASQGVTLLQQKLLWGSTARFEGRLRMRLYRAVIEADWPFFVGHKTTDLSAGLMNEVARAGAGYAGMVQMIGTAILIGIYLLLAFILSWQMTLVIAGMSALVLLLLRARVARGSGFGQILTDQSMAMWQEAGEHIAAGKTVKAYSVEDQTIDAFGRKVERFNRIQYKNQMNQAWLRFFYESTTIAAVFIGIYMAVMLFHMPISSLVVFLLVFYRVSPKVSAFQSQQSLTLSHIPALMQVDQLSLEAESSRETSGGRAFSVLKNRISLENVSFTYGTGKQVLHAVELEIPVSKSVGIVGPSGSGKTTIVDLILGLVLPTAGAARVDDVDLVSLDVRSWRARIGYVAQDSSFFHSSVAENIRFGCPSATDADVARAAELAFASDFIDRLPEGYDTIIGDRGVRLSGGQRQRLALARAIVRNPVVLVLDEATSALDSESEEKIQRAVDKLSGAMTIVTVTHRLATVKNADLIYFLDEGHVVESGTWDDLVARKGRFFEMQSMQSLRR